jgi:hypothetical protein
MHHSYVVLNAEIFGFCLIFCRNSPHPPNWRTTLFNDQSVSIVRPARVEHTQLLCTGDIQFTSSSNRSRSHNVLQSVPMVHFDRVIFISDTMCGDTSANSRSTGSTFRTVMAVTPGSHPGVRAFSPCPLRHTNKPGKKQRSQCFDDNFAMRMTPKSTSTSAFVIFLKK